MNEDTVMAILSLSPFGALMLLTIIGMVVRLGKHYLFADMYEAPILAKIGTLFCFGAFIKIIIDVANLKYEFGAGLGFLSVALLGGGLYILWRFAPVRPGEE